ncbi:putative peptidyl-tRNA hydrolase [Collichthys lucidus]|uniref:Putative peptidyl-tRNA hydrolase n=1 Tax=Collichthys lucidus TaxID=240159 RepID=A0A4U5USP6_COLLU|nr:putative peptidyl-tRNA hydrolase [Collichthys lucidus]
MRRLLTRVINRVLLSELFTPAMGFEAEIHVQGRRRMVVGLGNVGMEGTRHSVGMAVLGTLATRLGVADRWRGDKHVSGEVIMSEVQDTHVVLLRPRLLMNVNGVSVAKAAAKYGIKPEDILLVHDELDKPLGKIAIKHGGSARGHKWSPLVYRLSSGRRDAQTSSRDQSADRENFCGATCTRKILHRGAESSGLCSGPKRGPSHLPALPARLQTGPPVLLLLTSRGQTCSTEDKEEGALSLSS